MFAKFKAFLPKVIFSWLPFDNCLVSSLPHSERVQLPQRYLHSCTRSIQDDIQSWLQITNWDMNLLLDLKSNYSKVLNSWSSKYRVDLQCHLSLHFGLHLLSVKEKMLFLCKSRKETNRLQKTVIAKPFTIRGIIVSSKFWTFLWT